jgi:hypothetical protein
MRNLYAMLLVIGFASLAWGEDKTIDNPAFATWAKQKVGTTVTQKMTTEASGNKSETTMIFKLVEVKADKVVLEVTTKVKAAGMEFTQPAQNMDVEKTVKVPNDKTKAEIEKNQAKGETTEGEETLKISGKEYKTKWTKFKGKNGDIEYETQAWTSADMPNLTVKSVTKTSGKDANATSTTLVEVTEIKVP